MTLENINLAFRMIAMGRVNHPLVEELAGKLASVLETPEQRAEREMGDGDVHIELVSKPVESELPTVAPKKRPRKAD